MRTKKLFLFCFLFIFAFLMSVSAQESKYYSVSYENTQEVPNLKTMLDDYFAYFNDIFHFSKDGPGFKYKVKVFGSLEAFNAYVQEKTETTTLPKSETVFLRYEVKENSELAMVNTSINNKEFIRQLFVQYIFAYVNELPQWILSGFPLYFEGTEWQEGKKVVQITGGNPWLETAKALTKDTNRALTAMNILSAKPAAYPADQFMPQAYLLAYFFTNSPFAQCNRLFFDGLSMLKTAGTGDTFVEYQQAWLNSDVLEKSYRNFVISLRSVRDELTDGIAAYSSNDTDKAINYFKAALALDEKDSTAMYYIGLSMYKQKRYKDADIWYTKALAADNGNNVAYIYWALGTSAVADRRNQEAISHLNEAKKSNEEMFGTRVNDLIAQLR